MELNIYDNKNLKYYVDSSHMIVMNGDPDKYTNFMNAYNTFLEYFWIDNIQGVAFWAKDTFLMGDIRKTTQAFIEQVNKSEDEISIGMLSFIEGLKPAPHYRRTKYSYVTLMTYYDESCKDYGYPPIFIFHKIMQLLKLKSSQEAASKACMDAGLVYGMIDVFG
jgi:hypothetical protein